MKSDHDMTDRKLIQKIRTGDTSAFKIFISQYQKLVIHIVYRMINQQQDREDLVQDVFIKAYKSLTSFRFESKISTWLGRIAYNTCINHLQKRKIPLIADDIYQNTSEEIIDPEQKLPDDLAADQDFHDKLHKEVEKLPPLFRAIVTLYHLEQMSYREISEILDLPEGTVKSYLFRARSQLREQLISIYHHEVLNYETS
jgi:RNA polymerase sigma factor (sigma-70 family)